MCYQMRERIVSELLHIIEEIRLDAGVTRAEQATLYRIPADGQLAYEQNYKLAYEQRIKRLQQDFVE